MKRFSIALVLIVLSSAIALAQGTTGSLKGTVSGPDGVLPGATVTATDANTSREQTVTSGSDGSYRFTQLEFGTYTIKVTATGFKTLIANAQKIDVGREAALDLTLEVGEVSAEVVVTAGADVVTSTTAQVSNTVSPQQILSLPLLVRNPLALT
ncbi:MAG: carboxypeptidase regulatory-like domain-containing protein, partial [Acidobacteria bacterium]|nr:carboxypeptidase regulatory-like domain-containing protein [Acidobacteriota bacterium]